MLGRLGRGDAVGVRFREELAQRVADPGEPLLELRLAPAFVLEPDQLDDTAGVDDVVGRVEDAAVVQALCGSRRGELVVRASRDRAAGEVGDRLVVERAADGSGRVDVHARLEDALG